MDELLASLRHASAELVGAVLAAVLIIVLRATLPDHKRSLIRTPVVLSAIYLSFSLLRWLIDPSPGWRRALDLLSLLFLLLVLARVAVLLTVEVVFGRKRELPKIIRDITQTVFYAAVAIVVLRSLGMDPSSLLATSALLTAVIGLSLQETLGNLFAGLAIQMQRPFEVGDWIAFDADPKLIGRVLEINWRATKLLTLDEVEVVVPNGALAKSAIRNYTKPSVLSRRSVYVHASYDLPPHRVHGAIRTALREVPGVLDEPEATIVTNGFGDSGVEYWVRFFIQNFERRDIIDGQVRDRVWYALRREGIGIPFPQRVVHLHEVNDETAAAVEARAIEGRERVLRGVDFFDVLPEEECRALAAATQQRCYAGGEVIVQEGDQVNDLFIVASGEVVVMLDRPGEEHDVEIARLGPGKFFGEIESLSGERRFATVKAISSAELLVLGHQVLQDTLRRSPELAERVAQVLAERVDTLEGYAAAIPDAGTIDAEARRSHLLTRIRRFFSL
jgi:small-conductance mechanosensitive channel/CRP-like cAMP-binding protein